MVYVQRYTAIINVYFAYQLENEASIWNPSLVFLTHYYHANGTKTLRRLRNLFNKHKLSDRNIKKSCHVTVTWSSLHSIWAYFMFNKVKLFYFFNNMSFCQFDEFFAQESFAYIDNWYSLIIKIFVSWWERKNWNYSLLLLFCGQVINCYFILVFTINSLSLIPDFPYLNQFHFIFPLSSWTNKIIKQV